MEKLCGCFKCQEERYAVFVYPGPMMPGWRYACEICGNKRCPHHTDHDLACTDSNDVGQVGSAY